MKRYPEQQVSSESNDVIEKSKAAVDDPTLPCVRHTCGDVKTELVSCGIFAYFVNS